jgi:hypothetical protein
MVNTPAEIILPLVAGILAVTLVWAICRSRNKQDRAIRDIRANLDEAERQLKQLGWASHAEEER